MREKSQVEDIDRSIYDIRDEEKDAYRMKEGLTPQIVEQLSKEKGATGISFAQNHFGVSESDMKKVLAAALEKGGDYAREQHGDERADYESRRGHGLQAEDAVYGLLEGEMYGGVVVLVDAVDARGGDGEDGVGIGAYEHETSLAQREQAREAVEQVHRHRDERVDSALAHDGDEHVEP